VAKDGGGKLALAATKRGTRSSISVSNSRFTAMVHGILKPTLRVGETTAKNFVFSELAGYGCAYLPKRPMLHSPDHRFIFVSSFAKGIHQ
jgi:hypothetical protein